MVRAEITSLRSKKYVGGELWSRRAAFGKRECEESRTMVWCQIGKGSGKGTCGFCFLLCLFACFNE